MTNLKHWTRWFKKKDTRQKAVPPKTEAGYTYIMSDLHGCFDELNAMLAKIGFSDQDKLILAGDYIDRGSQNYEMLCWMEQVLKISCCCAAIMRKSFYVIWSCFWQCRRSGSL